LHNFVITARDQIVVFTGAVAEERTARALAAHDTELPLLQQLSHPAVLSELLTCLQSFSITYAFINMCQYMLLAMQNMITTSGHMTSTLDAVCALLTHSHVGGSVDQTLAVGDSVYLVARHRHESETST